MEALLNFNAAGWLEPVRQVRSPNYNQRPVGIEVELLVIHNISLPPRQFGTGDIDALFSNQLDIQKHPYFQTLTEQRVAAHFMIDRQGVITQYVSVFDRAWHAGVSSFAGRENCNDFSIGVELEGSDYEPFEQAQYQALAQLTQAIMKHFPNINTERIAGHSDIAPTRKTDPGPYFDWQYYFTLIQSLTGKKSVYKCSSGEPATGCH